MKRVLIKWFGEEWFCRNFHSHVKENDMWYCKKCNLHLKIYPSEMYGGGGPR